MGKASTSVERMSADQFKPREVKFVDIWEHLPLFEGLWDTTRPPPIVLTGPKGVGKSLALAAFAYQKKIPIITYDCSEDVRRSHLVGMFILKGNETPFILGPLATAFEVANEVGSCILVLEEINALTPQLQKLLNGVTDFRRRIEVPECGRVFELQPGKKLWITGTMNTTVYGGVYSLNEDLKSRLRLLCVDYPTPVSEKAIVKEALDGTNGKVTEDLIDQVVLLAHETRQKALEYALSPRDVVQIVEDINSVGLENALKLIMGKFEGDDRATVKTRVDSIFGVTIA